MILEELYNTDIDAYWEYTTRHWTEYDHKVWNNAVSEYRRQFHFDECQR